MQRLFLSSCVLGAGFLFLLLAGCPTSSVNTGPVANFKTDVSTGDDPLDVQFTDLSSSGSSPILSWQWDFGDQTGSSLPNPVKRYHVPAGQDAISYTVSLTVTTARGRNTKTVTECVTVSQPAIFDPAKPGQTVSQMGVDVTFPESLAEGEASDIGISKSALTEAIPAMEQVQVISSKYTITHTGTPESLHGVSEQGRWVPITVAIPIDLADAATAGIDSADQKIHVLALLPDGLTVPIMGTLKDGKVVIKVVNLPNRASYVAVYRRDSFDLSIAAVGQASTDDRGINNGWRVNVSTSVMQELTALRLGSLSEPAGYDRRDYSQGEVDATQGMLTQSLFVLRNQLQSAGLQTPALAADDGRYTLIFYPMSRSYSTTFEHFRALTCALHTFGQIVIDPMQLLAVNTHDAAAIESGAENSANLQQELTYLGSFASEMTRASFESYAYPEIGVVSNADIDWLNNPQFVHVLAGLREGAAVYTAQYADSSSYARAFDSNETALLSEPLFYPVSASQPQYAVASQDFLIYLRTALAPSAPLQFLLAQDNTGIFTSVYNEFQTELAERAQALNPLPIEFDEARLLLYSAIDKALYRRFQDSLGAIYWRYARARAIEGGAVSILRPTDANQPENVLRTSLFEDSALIHRALQNGTASTEISPDNAPSLGAIPPLSSRAILLTVSARSAALRLQFNSSEWPIDAASNTLAVSIYENGVGLVAELSQGQTEIDLTGLPGNPLAADKQYVILLGNLNRTDAISPEITASASAPASTAASAALEQYTHEAGSPGYSYTVEATQFLPTAGAMVYVTDMTSGYWRTAAEVAGGHELWRHKLAIIRPAVVTNNTALLYVTGGSHGSLPKDEEYQLLVSFAMSTGSVAAILKCVPNEPLLFTGETAARSEDEIIAYSFDKFMDGVNSGQVDRTWPLLFPMARAAVRAMDTVQAVMTDREEVNVNDFVVFGASKRGWTTWLTAAADARVKAIMPCVIDVLNMPTQINHHYQAYNGAYSTALQDYVDMGIFQRLDTSAGRQLLALVDPYSYRGILDLPKLIVNATGDQFFLPDAAQYYFGNLPGENFIYSAPNTEHGLDGSDGSTDTGVVEAMFSFFNSAAHEIERPSITWSFPTANQIVVNASVKPEEVRLWTATNPDRRDFRLSPENIATEGEPGYIPSDAYIPTWSSEVLTSGTNQYTKTVPMPAQGWTAFFVQVKFSGYGQFQMYMPDSNWVRPFEPAGFLCNTETRVIPETYP